MVRNEELLRLRLEGFSYGEISKQSGISRQRVQQLLAPPKAIRAYIERKASGKCQDCGITLGGRGHVHHRGASGLEPETFDDIENLSYLCRTCHRNEHRLTPSEQEGTQADEIPCPQP